MENTWEQLSTRDTVEYGVRYSSVHCIRSQTSIIFLLLT